MLHSCQRASKLQFYWGKIQDIIMPPQGREERDLQVKLSSTALLECISPPTELRAAKLLVSSENYTPTKGFSIRSVKQAQKSLGSLPSPRQRRCRPCRSPAVPAPFPAAEPTARAGTAGDTHHPRRAPSSPTSSESSQVTSLVTSEEREREKSAAGGSPRTKPSPAAAARPEPSAGSSASPALTEADEDAEPRRLLPAELQRVPQHGPAAAAVEHGALLRQRTPPPRRRRRHRGRRQGRRRRRRRRRWGQGRRRWGRRRQRRERGGSAGGPLQHDGPSGLRLQEQRSQLLPHRHLLPPSLRAPRSPPGPRHWSAVRASALPLVSGHVNPCRPRLLGSGAAARAPFPARNASSPLKITTRGGQRRHWLLLCPAPLTTPPSPGPANGLARRAVRTAASVGARRERAGGRSRCHGARFAAASGGAEIHRAPAPRQGRGAEGQPPGEAGAAGRERCPASSGLWGGPALGREPRERVPPGGALGLAPQPLRPPGSGAALAAAAPALGPPGLRSRPGWGQALGEGRGARGSGVPRASRRGGCPLPSRPWCPRAVCSRCGELWLFAGFVCLFLRLGV